MSAKISCSKKCASCLEPTLMISQSEVNKLQISALVNVLYSTKWTTGKSAENAKVHTEILKILKLFCRANGKSKGMILAQK